MNGRAILWGVLGGTGIALVFYSAQALGMQSFSSPYYFFQKNWYFISPLIILFAIQVGLWKKMQEIVKISKAPASVPPRRDCGAARPVAASGGVSTGAMIACCMHNFVGILSIIGVSGLAVFFATYQNYVFTISILFSGGGLAYMIYKYNKIKEHRVSLPKL